MRIIPFDARSLNEKLSHSARERVLFGSRVCSLPLLVTIAALPAHARPFSKQAKTAPESPTQAVPAPAPPTQPSPFRAKPGAATQPAPTIALTAAEQLLGAARDGNAPRLRELLVGDVMTVKTLANTRDAEGIPLLEHAVLAALQSGDAEAVALLLETRRAKRDQRIR